MTHSCFLAVFINAMDGTERRASPRRGPTSLWFCKWPRLVYKSWHYSRKSIDDLEEAGVAVGEGGIALGNGGFVVVGAIHVNGEAIRSTTVE